LKVGTRVRVRALSEIVETLDASASLGGMPFMPEMARLAGQTFTVDAVVTRTCDTIGNSGTTRGMSNTVHLEGVRCDGAGHGGCQARCLIYWRTEWLEPADEETGRPDAPDHEGDCGAADLLSKATTTAESTPHEPVYRCQATEVVAASCFASPYDPDYWIRDIKAGNATPREAVACAAVIGLNKMQRVTRKFPSWCRVHGGKPWPWYDATGERARYEPQGLEPGDLVRIRSREEIEATLDDNDKVRGLRFSAEMLPHCGKKARVLASLDRIINERTGRMLKLRDCYVLEGIWCEGTYRLMCRRKIYSYWRETWLERLTDSLASAP
jgi:hypothetical protein